MRLALRELRRRSRRFAPTTAALTLLVVLLLVLGGLLDGLYLGSTGALRAQTSGQIPAGRVERGVEEGKTQPGDRVCPARGGGKRPPGGREPIRQRAVCRADKAAAAGGKWLSRPQTE